MTYKLYKTDPNGEVHAAVRFFENGSTASFLFDPDNTDYQAYLKWVAESPDNVPLPADE